MTNNDVMPPQPDGAEGAARQPGLSAAKRALLQRRLAKNGPAAGKGIARRPDPAGPAPLSFAQQRLWLLDQLAPGSNAYNVPRALRVRGRLDAAALRRALEAVVARHEVLRTTFAVRGDDPVQLARADGALPLEEIDLRHLPESGREAEVQRLLQERAGRPFDLARDLMLRASLFRLAEQEHVLLLVSHHIASDGTSKGILFRDLAALYAAFAHGTAPSLPELPVQYADFAAWQRQALRDRQLGKQLTFWKERLAGVPGVLDLPTDRPRPAAQSYRGAKHLGRFPRPLSQAVKALGQQEGATLFMTVLAAFQALLLRYTGREDLLVGTMISGRSRPETERLIGLFVNTLVLRTDLSGDPTFRELLRRVRETALAAYDNPEVPFERLVEELQPERDLSRSPLFQVGFVLDPPAAVPSLPGLEVSHFEVDVGGAKNDLILAVGEDALGLKTKVEYSTDLFEEATIARMVGHLQTLLAAAAADPGRRLSELPILTEGERRQVLVGWNATRAEYPSDRCYHRLFEAQAEQTPDAAALVGEGERLTYRELNARANQLAHHLRAAGVGPETVVGIYTDRGPDMVVGLLGILKAGGAYLPLDPSYPAERLAFMLEDARAPLLLTQSPLAGRLPAPGVRVVCLDSAREALDRESTANLPDGPGPDDLAYLIYTSGSTGKPKGVEVPHCALVNFLAAMRRQPGLTGRDHLLAVTSLSFDIAGLELFLPLLVGARLEVVSREVAADGRLLLARLAESRPTVMQATPATWRLLLEAGWQGTPGLKVLCGGEALSRELADRLLATGAELWNMYGPTETTIWSLVWPVGPGPMVIGRPIANTEVYVLDAGLRPVPVGVPGELYLGGDGLARGYRNRPELTAERFVRHPFRTEPGARLYRTGDLARYRPDGNLEFLGRIDHQVKLRGFRIELGEIEAVLSQHPAVRQCVVVAREDVPGEKQLVAYVVGVPGQRPGAGDLRGHLLGKLPDYMVPSAFVCLEALPLTPNGKIDRRRLPEPERERPPEAAYAAPRTPVEEALVAIWAEVLRLDRVGVEDNFFALGGNSLLATRVMARTRDALQADLPLRSLFEAPAVAGLALAVTQARAARADAERVRRLLEQVTGRG